MLYAAPGIIFRTTPRRVFEAMGQRQLAIRPIVRYSSNATSKMRANPLSSVLSIRPDEEFDGQLQYRIEPPFSTDEVVSKGRNRIFMVFSSSHDWLLVIRMVLATPTRHKEGEVYHA